MVRRFATPILIIGALALVAVFGALTYQRVWAQEETPTAPETPLGEMRGKGLRGGHIGQTDEDLAAALGITVDELDAAKTAAAEKALEQAVAAGLITQEQADQLAERGFGGRYRVGPGMAESGIDPQALLAEALGISVDEFQAAQQQAFEASLARAVEEGALTQEQADMIQARKALFGSETFQSSMQSAFEAAVAEAVDSGLITQAQADQILAENAGKGFFGRGGPGFGGPRGGRHGHPGMDIPPDAQPDTGTQPETGTSDSDV